MEALNKAEWIYWPSRSIIRPLSQSLNTLRINWRANIFSFHFNYVWHLSKTVASCSIRRFLQHLIRQCRKKKVNWCVNKSPFVFWCSNTAHYLQIFDELPEPLRGSNASSSTCLRFIIISNRKQLFTSTFLKLLKCHFIRESDAESYKLWLKSLSSCFSLTAPTAFPH